MNLEKRKEYYEVSDLNKQVKALLDSEIGWVKVKGEVSSITPHRTGNFYFTLKDSQGQLEGVIFKNFVHPDLLTLKTGDYVYGIGVLTSYIKTGRISFQAFSLSKEGRGRLFDSLELLKKNLEQEGLFAPQKQLVLPSILKKIVIITALHAAALKDILSIVQHRIIGHTQFFIVPALMQGEKTAQSVMDALEASKNIPGIEAVLISRGGGAYEDLWGFNSEDLVRTIAAYPIPIISAIGHEQDYTLCDYAAHTRYATPSAAAYGLFSVKENLNEKLNTLAHKLYNIFFSTLSSIEWKLQKAEKTLEHLIGFQLKKTELQMDFMKKKLVYLNPLQILEKGYAAVMKKNEISFSPDDSLKIGDILEIYLQKGNFLVEVIQKCPPASR